MAFEVDVTTKKEIRLWKEYLMCAAVTVRLLHIRCKDTTSED
jgi:hypothetical protein